MNTRKLYAVVSNHGISRIVNDPYTAEDYIEYQKMCFDNVWYGEDPIADEMLEQYNDDRAFIDSLKCEEVTYVDYPLQPGRVIRHIATYEDSVPARVLDLNGLSVDEAIRIGMDAIDPSRYLWPQTTCRVRSYHHVSLSDGNMFYLNPNDAIRGMRNPRNPKEWWIEVSRMERSNG
jgi:hypothetical protein